VADAEGRLVIVAKAAGLDLSHDVEAVVSHSNDAWRVGDTVLRVCWRGDRGRLRREAAVVAALPDAIPHAEVLGGGEAAADLTWMLTRRLPGRSLDEQWVALDTASRRNAFTQLADALRALHGWTPPPDVAQEVRWRPAVFDTDSIIGVDLNPLPVDRALALVPRALDLAGVDPGLIDAVADRLVQLRPLDPFTAGDATVVTHGDAHLGNILWHDDHLVALLDFEWARWGPPDLELQAFCRLDGRAPAALTWLAEFYPGLVSHPRWMERVWLYDLAETLRSLLIRPPAADGTADEFHPLARLRDLVDGPGYLQVR
jgi:aminoglycoside phosphotransferase (APT) family kinase protein